MRIILVFLVIISSCNNKGDSVSSYNEGKELFSQKCIYCHTANASTTMARPSIKEMALLDSISLYTKLFKIKNDSVNHSVMNKCSATDLRNILAYLKNFNRKQY